MPTREARAFDLVGWPPFRQADSRRCSGLNAVLPSVPESGHSQRQMSQIRSFLPDFGYVSSGSSIPVGALPKADAGSPASPPVRRQRTAGCWILAKVRSWRDADLRPVVAAKGRLVAAAGADGLARQCERHIGALHV